MSAFGRWALAGVILASCPLAFALNPALDVSQYGHTAWKNREGFTKGMIYDVAQTPDGYLWLATGFGLVRFDGVKPVAWDPLGNQALPSNDVRKLFVDRGGTLWISPQRARKLERRQAGPLSRARRIRDRTRDPRS
jgi:ligand-binding sensor domain-containing protein